MEGHRLENEESTVYEPYQPQSFDEGGEVPARPAGGAAPPEADFDQGFTEEQARQATFDERPHEAAEGETDFASIKFQRENTLLTNAESYAASIREEAQLYVRQLRSEVEALNREAEQRYEEAERIKAEAEAEAERVKAEAMEGLDALREEARSEGFEAGREDGKRQAYEEVAPELARLEQVLKEISQFRRRVAFYTEKDGVRLALLIARKVLGTELKINKQAVAKLVASTLARMEGKGTFRVWLNPGDHALLLSARRSLERYLHEDQALTLRIKEDLQPGNVLIETDREVIDLTFQSQFYHLEQQLNQALDERETVLLNPRRGAAASQAAEASRPKDAAPRTRPGQGAGTPGKGAASDAGKGAARPAAKPASAGDAAQPETPGHGD